MNGLTHSKAPNSEEIFFQMILMYLERVSSVVGPRHFEESTILISLPSTCTWIETLGLRFEPLERSNDHEFSFSEIGQELT